MRVAAAGVADEFDAQTPISELTLASIDTETTGTDSKEDRIVEIACVKMRGGVVIDQRDWLINPERPIPKEASDVHGILDADVADKPTFAEQKDAIMEALRGAVPVAYNAEFDRAFILEEFARAGGAGNSPAPAARPKVQWIDPLVWARELYRDEKSKALGAMAELLGVQLENAHRATDDAVAAGRVLAKFFDDSRVPKAYGAFMQEQRRLGLTQREERQYWRSP